MVSGQVSTLQDQNIIQLGLTADTERLPIPLSGAFIVLFDDEEESYSYAEDPLNPGTYILADLSGKPGRTYHVRIERPSGEVYESKHEKMPEVVGQLRTHYEFEEEEFTDLEGIVSTQPFIKIYVNTILPATSEPSYLKWSIEEAYLLSPTDFPDIRGEIPPPCYIIQNADPQRIALFNNVDVPTTSVDNLLAGSRVIDWTFLEKHYFTTYQTSLTKDAYEYWRKVNILANQVGSIFDTPPAEITGNISRVDNSTEKVLGYFQATNQTYDRLLLHPYDMPFPLLMESCTYDGTKYFNDYPSRCLDCLSVRNSSHTRPSWFD